VTRTKLTLPVTTHLFGVEFEVKNVKLPDDQYGECCAVERLIKVDVSKHKSPAQLERTLRHEEIHGLLRICGIGEILESKCKDKEEAIVVCLENGLETISRVYKE
jgi:hypothetical protein